MMHILIHDYAGHPFQIQLSRKLASPGRHVSHGYFAGDAGPKGFMEKTEADPVEFEIVPFNVEGSYNKSHYLRRRQSDLKYGAVVSKWILNKSPDVVISGNCPSEIQEKIYKACTKAGSLFIPWVQDLYSVAATSVLQRSLPFIGWPVAKYYSYLDGKHLKNSHANILICDAFMEQMKKWNIDESKNHIIPNWGSLNDVSPKPKNNRWSLAHGLDEKFVFMYCGTLGIKHMPERIVEISDAFKNNGQVEIVVIGQGRGYEWIENSIEKLGLKNLSLIPLLPIDELEYALGGADVTIGLLEEDAGKYAVPSKILNYMCAGKPILLSAPKNNQAYKVVEQNKLGLSVESNNSDEFVSAAIALYDEEKSRNNMSVNALSYAEENFNIDVIKDRFLTVINK